MCCRRFWKSVAPFFLAFALSVFAIGFLQKISSEPETEEKNDFLIKEIYSKKEQGRGQAACRGRTSEEEIGVGSSKIAKTDVIPVKILSKPRANYTDAARANQTSGVVRVRVVFLANGEIGRVVPVATLPDGLTEQAIEAAKQIKFEPATREGKPVVTTKIVEYSFTIY